MTQHRTPVPESSLDDAGYTLVELILVIVILGVLASVVVFAISGMSADAAESSCAADSRALGTAVESYFAQAQVDSVPATGIDDDRFEQTLVDGGFLRAPSTVHDLDASGVITAEADSSC